MDLLEHFPPVLEGHPGVPRRNFQGKTGHTLKMTALRPGMANPETCPFFPQANPVTPNQVRKISVDGEEFGGDAAEKPTLPRDAAVSVEIGGTMGPSSACGSARRMSGWFRLVFVKPNFTGDGEPGDHRRSFDRGSR